MESLKVQSVSWDCPICKEVMNGDNGDVAISKRCFHVFHDNCIRQWVNEHKGECPTCRLPNFSNVELISNPAFAQQYKLWKADPEGYSYEREIASYDYEMFDQMESTLDLKENKGFEPKYPYRNKSLKPEDVLRPKELRGLERRKELRDSELKDYSKEMLRQMNSLDQESSDTHKVNKIFGEIDRIQNMQLERQEIKMDKIAQDQDKIAQDQDKIAQDQDKIAQDQDRQDLALEKLEKRIYEVHNMLKDNSSRSTHETSNQGSGSALHSQQVIQPASQKPKEHSPRINRKRVFTVMLIAIGILFAYKARRSNYVKNFFKVKTSAPVKSFC